MHRRELFVVLRLCATSCVGTSNFQCSAGWEHYKQASRVHGKNMSIGLKADRDPLITAYEQPLQ